MESDPRKIVDCLDCKKPTNPRETGTHLECVGFVEYRGAAGGTNNLRFKKYTGKVLCSNCAMKRTNGTQGMDSLF